MTAVAGSSKSTFVMSWLVSVGLLAPSGVSINAINEQNTTLKDGYAKRADLANKSFEGGQCSTDPQI